MLLRRIGFSNYAMSYATTFEDISSSLQKKWVRFGVWVYNSSGTAMEFATVAIRCETRST